MVYKLKGHATPLVGVKHIPDSPEVWCCFFLSWGSVATCCCLSLPTSIRVWNSLSCIAIPGCCLQMTTPLPLLPGRVCVGVCCQVITASVDGQVMVWDLRMLRCVQTFNDSSSVGLDGGMNCFETCPSRKQIVCAGKSLSVYRQVRAVLCTFFVPSSTPVHRPSTFRVGPSGSAFVALRPPWLAMCYALLCGVCLFECAAVGLALVRLAGHGPSAGKAHGE
jgi:WD40 repeat protein